MVLRKLDLVILRIRILQNIQAKSEKSYTYIYIYIYRERERDINNESFGLNGLRTVWFCAKHALWNKPTLHSSINDLKKQLKRLNVKMK